MRNIGLTAALAAAIIMNTASVKPAKADGGTTAAIITAVVAIASLRCKDTQDKDSQEFLCILPPPRATSVVVTGSVLLPKTAPLPKSSFLFDNSIRVVQALHPKVKYVKLPDRTRGVAAIKKTPPDAATAQTASTH